MAMARKENGSLLGVITAATAQRTTMAPRRPFPTRALLSTPTNSRNTSTTGYTKATPNTTQHNVYRPRYLAGENRGTTPAPLTPTSQVMALGNTSTAVVTPRANRVTAATMNPRA